MYIKYSNGVLTKDGFSIRIDELDADYQEYLAWIAAGNIPEQRDGSEWMAKLEQDKISLESIKKEYLLMLTRLEQIQTATNPNTTQIIQAVRDEAQYIERILKILHRILT